jgi:hypothetical protein
MSIFEPIPRESRSADDTSVLDDAGWLEDAAPSRESFDPRSIWIAGLVVSGIVATGLVVSNSAQPDARRPALASRADPGAAAVEQAEVKPSVPTAAPSASASAEPVGQTSTDDDQADTEDRDWSRDSRGDDRRDKPGKGRGHGRD